MKKIIIRDDDTSFYTSPELLNTVYAPLWQNNYPVCLAVIPAVHSNVIVEHRPGKPFDPGIPPAYRGKDLEHSILDNPSLCEFLNEKAHQGLVEICLHGYSHTYMEYTTTDRNMITNKLDNGISILNKAFPNVNISTFIAPYDHLSSVALEMIIDYGLNICTNSSNLAQIPDFADMTGYQETQMSSGRRLFTCDEYLFTHRDQPELSLQNTRQLLQNNVTPLIITNHYWMFFYDWSETNEKMLHAWHQALDDLIAQPDAIFTTFNTD